MRFPSIRRTLLGLGLMAVVVGPLALGQSDQSAALPRAFLDGTGPGWKELGEADFTAVNCEPETWTCKDGVVHCTGQPVGVIRTKKSLTNFEIIAEWKHLQSGGNSGIFVWASEKSIDGLKPDTLPRGGIEVQILDHGYQESLHENHRQESRLVHDSRRRLCRRHLEDDSVPTGLAQWQS